MNKMYFYILIFMIIYSFSIAEGGKEDFDSDLLFQSFGCLKKTQVTVFVPVKPNNLDLNVMGELREYLAQSNCHSLFMFLNDVKKSFPFEKDLWVRSRDAKEKETDLSMEEIVAIIQEETFVDNPNLRQTLLFIQDRFFSEDILLFYNIPFHRIVPDFSLTQDNVKIFIDLVRNPNFNRFENIKHHRSDDDERLKCLKNKTVHIQLPPSISLIENILLLAYNSEEFSTKIIYYNDQGGYQYLDYFVKYFEPRFEGRLSMVSGYNAVKKRFKNFSQKTDDIYLVKTFKSYEIPQFCGLPLQGRKGFVYYGSTGNSPRECWDRFERLTLKEMKFYKHFYKYEYSSIYANVISIYANDISEDVLKVSCF